MCRKMILHIDMDAFYASVEERENPDLKGRPLIVGGRASARGVVAAANYAAREFGVYSAMPTATAVKRCPGLMIIKPRGDLYSQVSRQITAIFNRYTPRIEPLSLDEAFLDPGGSERLYGGAIEIGRRIKSDIKQELELIASVGVAPNKFLAKLASDHGKPDGFTVIHAEQVQSFLDPLPVERIWGVGRVTQARLAEFKINSVLDLRSRPKEFLIREFGKHGQQLWNLAHGVDDRAVTPDSEVKSVSQETTFDHDITEYDSIESSVMYLTECVGYRLREAGIKGKTVTVKIRYDDFRTITRSRSLDFHTNATDDIWREAKQILRQTLKDKPVSIRLAGVRMSGFGENERRQKSIFDRIPDEAGPENPRSDKKQLLDSLTDKIKNKYGKESIKRGKSIRTN